MKIWQRSGIRDALYVVGWSAFWIILVIGIFLLPTLYVWVARKDDILPAVESNEEF